MMLHSTAKIWCYCNLISKVEWRLILDYCSFSHYRVDFVIWCKKGQKLVLMDHIHFLSVVRGWIILYYVFFRKLAHVYVINCGDCRYYSHSIVFTKTEELISRKF